MNNIDDIWLKHGAELARILNFLAKRSFFSDGYWCEWANKDDLNRDVRCNICGVIMGLSQYRLHGFNHLKEKHLLPFI